MKKILILIAGFATLACAMDVPQVNPVPETGPENTYVKLTIKNKTPHNLVIVNNTTNEVVTGIKTGEIKNNTEHLSFAGRPVGTKTGDWDFVKNLTNRWFYEETGQGQLTYRIDKIANGQASTIGFLINKLDLLNDEVWFKLYSYQAIINAEPTSEIPLIDMDKIRITSSRPQTIERIDIDVQIVLEGVDLGQSKIEDVMAVIH